MRSRSTCVLAAGALGAAAAARVSAQAVSAQAVGAQPGAADAVAGRVVGPGGAPVAGAVVRVLLANSTRDGPTTRTDAVGRFRLSGVPAGVVRLEVRRVGYATRIVRDVAVGPAPPAEVRVVLEPAAVALAGVTVRPSYVPGARGGTKPVSTAEFSTEEIRHAPGVQEDAVRALSVLPGVGVTTESRNDLAVRGGAPAEVLFVVDGLEVPNINHFGGQGSTGGATSLVPADFVREAALSTGGFGARYGDRASAVVDLALRDGARDRAAGQLNVSAVGAGALAEGPLGGSGSFLAGVRQSYLGPIFGLLGAGFVPTYGDVTLKAAFRPSARDEVEWFAVGGRSTVAVGHSTARERYAHRDVIQPNETQYFTGATWWRRLARGHAAVTVGRTYAAFSTEQEGPFDYYGPSQLLLRAHTAEGEEQARAALVWSPDSLGARTFEVGATLKYADRLHYDVYLPGVLRRDVTGDWHPLQSDTSFGAFRGAAYAQADARLAPRLRASLGLRGDYYAFLHGAARLAPRASLTWAPDEASALSVAGGRYWQAPQPIWLVGDAANRPGAAGGGLRPFRADHLVLGWERAPRPDVRVRVEAYAKWYADYPARLFRPGAVLQAYDYANVLVDIPFGLEPLASTATGRVRGVEVLAEKKPSDVPVYGLASLSLSRTQFRALGRPSTPGALDVPVVATALGGWRPTARWELSGRVRVASGAPTTPFDTSGTFYGTPDPAQTNRGPRRTPFFALDARAERRFTWRNGRPVVAYLDVQNLTDRHNWVGEEWSDYRQAPFHDTTLGWLPSAGVRWTF